MENLGVMRDFRDFKFHEATYSDHLNIYFMQVIEPLEGAQIWLRDSFYLQELTI